MDQLWDASKSQRNAISRLSSTMTPRPEWNLERLVPGESAKMRLSGEKIA